MEVQEFETMEEIEITGTFRVVTLRLIETAEIDLSEFTETLEEVA